MSEPVTEAGRALLTGYEPCPFCGGERAVVDRTDRFPAGPDTEFDEDDRWAYAVRCLSCAAVGPWHKSLTAAVSAWERRPEDHRLMDALALLRLLGADRACKEQQLFRAKVCGTHNWQPWPPDAARCTVGVAWDALGADHG